MISEALTIVKSMQSCEDVFASPKVCAKKKKIWSFFFFFGYTMFLPIFLKLEQSGCIA